MTNVLYKRRLASKLLLYLAAALLAVGMYLYVGQVRANHRASQAAQRKVNLANQGQASPAPATIKPTTQAVNTYSVAATHPRYLLIPKLQIKARVLAVGVTKAHAIGTPSNVYDAAWYSGSSLPGQTGATLIDGHVSSWTTHGVFYNLKTLRAGDQISIQLGNNKLVNYRVVRARLYDAEAINVSSLLTPINQTKSGLNLITCTGDVSKGTNEFKQRVVVYAEQV